MANGVVYVGSFDRKLHAVDVNTGASRWVFETGGYALYSSPCVVMKSGKVYHSGISGAQE